MAYVTFEEIRHLVDSQTQERGTMRVYFKCPVSGHVEEATGVIPQSVGNKVANEATQSGIRHLLSMVTQFIKQLTGVYIPLGNTTASTSLNGGRAYASEEAKQAGVIAAFETKSEYPGKPTKLNRFNKINNEWQYVS